MTMMTTARLDKMVSDAVAALIADGKRQAAYMLATLWAEQIRMDRDAARAWRWFDERMTSIRQGQDLRPDTIEARKGEPWQGLIGNNDNANPSRRLAAPIAASTSALRST